ncbi:MAG: prolyl oligopeptidase family serine peptidase [Gemmatimonadaceae bacterium]
MLRRCNSRLTLAIVGLAWGAGAAAQTSPRVAIPEDAIAYRRIQDLAWSADGNILSFTVVAADTARKRWLGDIWVADEKGPRSLVSTTAHERGARWSPDGKWIAYLADSDSASQLWIVPHTGGAARRLTSAPDGVAEFDWMSDGRAIAFTSERAGADGDTLHAKAPAGDPVVVGAGERYAHLWVVDLGTGRVTERAHIAGALSLPRVRPGTGDVLVERRPTGRANDADISDLLLVSSDGVVVELTSSNPGSDWSASWSPDGAAFIYLTNAPNSNATNVAVHTMASGTARIVRALSGYDASGPELIVQSASRAARRASYTVSAVVGRGVSSRVWSASLGGDSGTAWTPDTVVVEEAAWSPGMRVLATVESSPVSPRELFFRTGNTGRRRVTALNDVQYAIGPTRVVRWKGADGLELEGVLIVPTRAVGVLPTLVRVHGGPYGKYDLSFDPFAQMIVGRGYALFEPNYRGSEGYGEEFSQLVRGDYGGKNHSDIMAGVDSLIARGIADPDRLGIFGWSYGGFSTSWALTQTNRFGAGVAGAGMSNMLSHYGTSDIQRYREYMSYGSPWDTAAARYLWERSPIRNTHAVKAPLLLLHGESDRRVAISQSEEFFTALRRLGAPVEFVRYPREPHSFREPLHQVDRDRRIANWFDGHLKR